MNEDEFDGIVGNNGESLNDMLANLMKGNLIESSDLNRVMLEAKLEMTPVQLKTELAKAKMANTIYNYITFLFGLLSLATIIGSITLIVWLIIRLVNG